MKRKNLSRAVLIALVIVAGVEGTSLFRTEAAAQTSQARARDVPMFEVDPSWPKVPAKWKLGDASSISIDAQGNAWVLHRPRTLKPDQAAMAAPPVIVFDAAGNFIKVWGGAGSGYEWVEREHGIHIDYKGFVWLGGNNCAELKRPGLKPVADDQLLKFTPDGKFVMQIGSSNQSKGNSDTKNVHRAADLWVHPQTNEAFVADGYGNHRVIVFDADTGAFKRMWGAFGNKPVDDDNCQAPTIKSFSDPGPQNFSIVHAIRVANDGTVYVADREYRRVQMFTNDGKFVKQLVKTSTPFARIQRDVFVGKPIVECGVVKPAALSSRGFFVGGFHVPSQEHAVLFAVRGVSVFGGGQLLPGERPGPRDHRGDGVRRGTAHHG